MGKLGNVIPTRFTDEEKHALKTRAQLEGSTTSEIARKAIRQFLKTPVASASDTSKALNGRA